ncbi:MAG: hypothetical protein Q7S09_04315 [bacterium]|nr:hypothetical protein [bacterium]
MRKDSKKSSALIMLPALKAEVRELVHLPRRSPDVAVTFAYEPTHVNEIPLGNLYMIGHIEDASLQEQTLLNSLFLEVRRTYYRTAHGLPEERFHRTLQQLNTYLQEHIETSTFTSRPARCHIHLMVIADGAVLVSETGSVFSYLVRGELISSISHKNAPELATTSAYPFTHLVRGRLMAQDQLLAVTPHFIDTSLIEKIDSVFLSPPLLEELTQHAKLHLAQDINNEGRAAAAIITRISNTSAIEQPDLSLGDGGEFLHHTSRPETRPNHRNLASPNPRSPRASPSMINQMLESMAPGGREKYDFAEEIPREKMRRTPFKIFASGATRYLLRWYVLLPVVSILLLTGMIPHIVRTHEETTSRVLLSDRMSDLTARIRTEKQEVSQIQKRSMLADSLQALNGSLFQKNIPEETEEVRLILENAIRQIDRITPISVFVLADFSKLAIEFSPEILLEGEMNDYIIAEKSFVQLLRVTENQNLRFLITGIISQKKTLAVAVTAEGQKRLALLTPDMFAVFEPQTKTYREQDIRIPKTITEPVFLVSGVKEIFAVSQNGPIARKMLNEKKSDVFTPLALGKQYNALAWRGAAVLSPALYLLSEDHRLLQVVGGKVTSDKTLGISENFGGTVRLRGLKGSKLLAILDEENRRIIIASPDGKIVKQYRHELFIDMRDSIEAPDGTILVLTETLLLQVSDPGSG